MFYRNGPPNWIAPAKHLLTNLHLCKYTLCMKTRVVGVIVVNPIGDSAVEMAVQQTGLTLEISFAIGQVWLTAEQQSCVKAWRRGWRSLPGKVDVILGGACHTARAGRLRRLHGLITMLEQMGVDAKRILPEVDLIRPARMGYLDDAPADMMWLRLCPHTQKHIAA